MSVKKRWSGRTKAVLAAVLLAAAVLVCWFVGKQRFPDGAPWAPGAGTQPAAGQAVRAGGDGAGTPAAEAAPFGAGGYVRSATYFGDAWPMNFWNSEMDGLDRDMAQIREDGFDSVILVIPWKEFQVSTDPVEYSDYAFEQLDRVMRAAGDAGLKVYARVSYLWDLVNDDTEDVFSRVVRLFHNPVTRSAWKEYAGKLYARMSGHASFAGGFLTWEDYMKPFLTACGLPSLQDRVDAAKLAGLQDYLRSEYSLEEFNKAFGTDYGSFDAVPFPGRKEPAMKAVYAYFDRCLNRLLADGQEAFPNLSMEIRLDADPVYSVEGTPGYYTHEATYACQAANYTAAMYGIPMGFENQGERVTAKDALVKTEYMLKLLAGQNGGKPVYIEQFVFYDNTPEFAMNARLQEEEVGEYLRTAPEVLRKYSAGYGVWTYRDYTDNILFNSGFLLEGRGWETEGNVSFEKKDSAVCRLSGTAALRQAIPAVREHFAGSEVAVSFGVAECAAPCTVAVTVGTQRQEVAVDGAGTYSAVFPRQAEPLDFGLSTEDGNLSVDNLRLYTHVQHGFLYDTENRPLEQRDSIREMNRLLAGE